MVKSQLESLDQAFFTTVSVTESLHEQKGILTLLVLGSNMPGYKERWYLSRHEEVPSLSS